MGGGPSSEQKAAAASQAGLSQAEIEQMRLKNAREQEMFNLVKPYGTTRLANGLPFMSSLMDYSGGQNAAAFAPARAQILRNTSRFSNLPSGYRDSLLANLEAARARAFDTSLTQNQIMNEQAKSEAARLLTGQQQIANPLGWAQAAGSTNQSIMQAPLQSPGIGGILGGVAQAAIPFI